MSRRGDGWPWPPGGGTDAQDHLGEETGTWEMDGCLGEGTDARERGRTLGRQTGAWEREWERGQMPRRGMGEGTDAQERDGRGDRCPGEGT